VRDYLRVYINGRWYIKMAWHNLIIHVILAGALTIAAGAAPSISQVAQGSTARREISGQRLSQGCGRSAPEASATHLMVSGRRRQFILTIPKGYRSKQPQWLVFAFHGRTDTSAKVRGYYDLERHATHPTLFVYPSGLKDQSGRFTWSAPRDQASALRDYAFFDALLAAIGKQYCIALDHVYIVGHSLGAWFGNSLACARATRIRAVATLGGSISASACNGAVAAMIAHNPKDRLVPFADGQRVRDTFLKHNGLLEDPGMRLAATDLNCRRYGSSSVRHPVLWCPHTRDYTWRGKYYPHNWPRSMGQAMMAFFAALPG
jgi:polyhydroxybutyrate depolymerase